MNIKKILKSPLINKAELSRQMWPGNKNSHSRLSNKIGNMYGQRITPKDESKIIEIIEDLIRDEPPVKYEPVMLG